MSDGDEEHFFRFASEDEVVIGSAPDDSLRALLPRHPDDLSDDDDEHVLLGEINI